MPRVIRQYADGRTWVGWMFNGLKVMPIVGEMCVNTEGVCASGVKGQGSEAVMLQVVAQQKGAICYNSVYSIQCTNNHLLCLLHLPIARDLFVFSVLMCKVRKTQHI